MVKSPFRRRHKEEEVKIEVSHEHEGAKEIHTKSGLDVIIFSESIAIERRQGLLALDIQLARRGVDTPEEAEYRIIAYKSLGDIKLILPGAIYIGKNGINIKGLKLSSTSNEVFDYRAEP